MEDFFRDNAQQKKAISMRDSEHLPKACKPVKIENFYLLPPEFIFAYTVLKNSGYLAEDTRPQSTRQAKPLNSYQNFGSSNSGLSNMLEEIFKMMGEIFKQKNTDRL